MIKCLLVVLLFLAGNGDKMDITYMQFNSVEECQQAMNEGYAWATKQPNVKKAIVFCTTKLQPVEEINKSI